MDTAMRAPAVQARELDGRIECLDAVRGLASLCVVAAHFLLMYGFLENGGMVTHTPLDIWWDGSAAVSLFFVLSGLVLSLKYFRAPQTEPAGHPAMIGYIVARCCRIWLPYLVTVLVCALLLTALPRTYAGPPTTAWFRELYAHHPTVRGIIRESSLCTASRDFLIVPQAWTLAIELTISLLVPFTALVARWSAPWLILATVFTIAIFRFPGFAFHFALGILIAKYCTTIRAWHLRWYARTGIAALGILLYTAKSTWAYRLTWIGDRELWSITGAGAALLLVVVLASPALQRILSSRWARHIGKVSYGIYLLHLAVLFWVTPPIINACYGRMSPGLMWAVGASMTVGLTIALATAFYWLVEQPSIQLGRRLSAVLYRDRARRLQTAPA